jgi:hypothetical protein
MAKIMHDILLDSTKATFVVAPFVDVFCQWGYDNQ